MILCRDRTNASLVSVKGRTLTFDYQPEKDSDVSVFALFPGRKASEVSYWPSYEILTIVTMTRMAFTSPLDRNAIINYVLDEPASVSRSR